AEKKRLGEGVGLHEASGWRGYRTEGDVIHMGARLYHYPTARFLSADPLGHASDISLYSYANNDPVNGVDPTGRHSSGLTSGISGFNSTQIGNQMSYVLRGIQLESQLRIEKAQLASAVYYNDGGVSAGAIPSNYSLITKYDFPDSGLFAAKYLDNSTVKLI
ncbi:MAG: RHS repeat-associated core domain-containing protein, partial [Methylacidiphilales bacterium]|nr:RHS repeat-associated core domain-containing protein [Candidatus Methylacidiphilales bacterium]